ncbi:hypothetical protein BGX20_010870 [Mortierella sp. AD010]|nr:hypothetical protein BGX20_010870 [Mortierella sp. AD010]
MVSATSNEAPTGGQSIIKVKAPSPKAGFRNQSLLIRSQPIYLDLDAFPAPTSPLPIPKQPTPPSRGPSCTPPSTPSKVISEKPSSPTGTMSNSLRPPPRPRSIVSQLTLSKPPSESLPPIPTILHSNDNLHISSTPTSPTTPTTPPLYPSFTSRYEDSNLSRPSYSIRSSSLGRLHGNLKNKTPRKVSNASSSPAQKETQRGRSAQTSITPLQKQERSDPMSNMEGPINGALAPRPETNEEERQSPANVELPSRPVGLVATRFYGIESSMRWREGVDPIQKRFASSNGSWRCQDRFAIFFRPGDQIGPDQVVTKTFWSEAWPYPIETILYGTGTGTINPLPSNHGLEVGHRSNQDGELSSRLKTGLRLTSSETQLKNAASFPPTSQSKDPRYINSDGVQKIAKVTIPMPDVPIDHVDLVKAPIKVELRIFILEAPLRIHASAFLLSRNVAGTVELYV